MQFEKVLCLSFVFFVFFGGFQLHLITIVYLVHFGLFFFQREFIRRLFQIGHADEVRLVFFRFLNLVQPTDNHPRFLSQLDRSLTSVRSSRLSSTKA